MVIPQENERDLKEIPDNIKAELDIKPVKWIDEVLEIALERMPKPLSDEEYLANPINNQEASDAEEKNRINTH